MKLLDAIAFAQDFSDSRDAIPALLSRGCAKSVLKIVIQELFDTSAKDIEAAVKTWEAANKSTKQGAQGFAAEFYDWLAEEARTEQEAYELIMSGSKNVQNHLTHYLNIWALAETVRSGKKVYRTISSKGKVNRTKTNKEEQPQDTWEYNDASPFADIRSAWETLKREKERARPRKTRIHPDKVAKFSDEKLTEAYTAAFKAYFNKAA